MPGLSDLLQSGSLSYSNPTPSSVAARRALAEQLLKGSVNNSMSPLGALAQTLGGSFSGFENSRATQDEEMGQQGASSALAAALQGDPSFESLSGIAGNPWLNQGQSGLVNTLLGKEIDQRYPQMTAAQSDYNFAQTHPDFAQTTTDPMSTVEGRASLADQYGLQGDERTRFILTSDLPGGNANVRAGVGQPIFGRNRTTLAVEPWQSMTDGSMVNIANPDANPADYDFNPGIAAAERTNATVDAKTAAAARAALPGAEQALTIADDAINALLGDTQGMAEQFGNTLGIPNQKIPDMLMMPQSPMARFRVNLAQGQGNAFLQARNVLKGGGPITDFEGAKAEAAYSRMQLAANNNNQEEFVSAAQDFQRAIHDGYQKLKQTANEAYVEGAPAVVGGQGDDVDALVNMYLGQ